MTRKAVFGGEGLMHGPGGAECHTGEFSQPSSHNPPCNHAAAVGDSESVWFWGGQLGHPVPGVPQIVLRVSAVTARGGGGR
jgi:hypothetical protein